MALSKASSSASHPLPQPLGGLESREPKDAVSFHYLKQPKPWTTYTSDSKPTWKYDVFLSFRGEDTRQGFVSHLYDELQSTGRIKTFKDDQGLQVGMFISPNLLTAIKESMLAIVVLSPNYASSPWCLDELTHIFEFMEGRDRILPIFYHVDPAAVRHQLGSFATAFTDHEKKSRYSEEKLNQWRVALKQVACISGWNTKNLESERELVKRIAKAVSSTKLEVQIRPIEIDVTITSTPGFGIFESTRQALDEVIKALINDEVTTIGVYGMGGVGKTTMVTNVGEQACNNGLFDRVIKAVASQCPDFRKIQGNFAEQLNLRLKAESVYARAAELKNMIMSSPRILIILDDTWETIDLCGIGIPNPDELKQCNSKLLLTTRRLYVCHSMGCQASFPLNMLSKEDSLNFFLEQSRISCDVSTEIYNVAREIAGECAGLPIALIATARALGDKDLYEWRRGLQLLRASRSVNPDDEGHAFECIKLSYDYLKSEDQKSLFLLCCLFPEDYDIPIEDLLKYALGKGLFQKADTIEEARNRANYVINHLKSSSLLLDSPKEGCVKMHDVVRDSALSIARDDHEFFLVKAGCELEYWPRMADRSYSAISLMMNHIRRLPQRLVCSKFQILLLQNNVQLDEIPESFFQRSNALRVLDISFTRISSLPSSFSFLANLRALFLDYCNELVDISIFGNMKKLEILSMKEFPLKELPKEMRYLTNLRMLDLSGSYNIGMFPYNVMSRWCKLEELYMKCNSGDWGSEIHGGGEETNVGPNELFGLKHLHIVKLRISDAKCLPKQVVCDLNWVTFDISISRESPTRDYSSKPLPSHDRSRTLTLNTTINSLPDWFINTVTEKAEMLQYLKCRGLKNLLVEYNRGRLHGLKNLVVVGPHENLEVLMETLTLVPNKPVFENLEELHLLGVSCLKELCLGELPVGSLCNLKVLKVEYCHDLVNALLPSNLWQRLQNLERLICEDMNGMEYVFGSKWMEPKDIILINLREMILWNLEKLIGIWNGPASNAVFSNLKSLAVYGCTKLKSVFTYDIAQYLLHLEELSVTQCSSLNSVIETRKEAVNKFVFPELKNLALSYLPQLKRFCSTEIATIEYPSLEHLHVQDCPSFSTSISDFHCTKQFQVNDLRHLRMSNDLDNINLAGWHTIDILESLPHNVRKRVEMMREIESQRDELEAKFLRERAVLEAKYQNLYQTLYGKRYLIVNGVVEAEGVATEAGADEDSTAKERGVPDFWLNVLKNNKVVAKEITECDEGALKYLRDIKWFKIHDSKGFILEFYFDSNPFFKNSVLTKTYQMIDEDEPNSAPGTEIEWYPAKCLTQKILKKKCKKGSKNSKPLTKTENCKSFFNFFSPPQVSKDNEVIDEVAAKELKNQKKQDYDVGSTISRKIIPQAVSWFTGEAI